VLVLPLALALAARGACAQAGLEDRLPAPLLLVTASDPSPFLHPDRGLAVVRALRDPELDLPRLRALLAEIDALRGPTVFAVLSSGSSGARPPTPQFVLGVDLGGRAAQVQEMLRARFAKASAPVAPGGPDGPDGPDGEGGDEGRGIRAEALSIAGTEVFAFADSVAPEPTGPPGARILATVVDNTVVVTSSRYTMERILASQSAGQHDPRIASLRAELASGRESLFVFADWKKLNPHVLAFLRAGQDVLYRALYRASGLAELDCVGIDIRPENGGFRTRARFRFAGERAGIAAMLQPEAKPKRFAQDHVPGRLAHLELRLDKEHAMAAISHAFGPDRGRGAVATSARGSLMAGARRFGLDLELEVLARLGEHVTIDVLSAGPAQGPGLVVALDARSPKDATALVRALGDRLAARGFAQVGSVAVGKGIVRLSDRLLGRHAGATRLEVAAAGHRILVGFSPDVLARYLAAVAAGKPGARAHQDVQASGFVELDHRELVARLRAGLARSLPDGARPAGPAGSSSGFLKAEADGFSLDLVCRPAH
jgi:hypothetical protein